MTHDAVCWEHVFRIDDTLNDGSQCPCQCHGSAGYATEEKDMHWHLDSRGQPCACIEEEHDDAPRSPTSKQ